MTRTHVDVETQGELALGALDSLFEHRYGYRGNEAARTIDDLYGRTIYTDRGEYPTQAELNDALARFASDLEWDQRSLKWKRRPQP